MDAEHEAICEQAAAWLARRDRGLTAEEGRALESWLAADPRHDAELNRLTAAWTFGDRAIESAGLRALAASVRERPDPAWKYQPSFPASRRSVVILAGAVAAVVALGFWVVVPRPKAPSVAEPSLYRVLPSEARTLALSDGSVVQIKNGAELQTAFSPQVRRTVLRHGEAIFSVAKNPNRPFIVSLGSVAVRAVGTAFDINVSSKEVSVLVTHGKVAVEDERVGHKPAVPLLVAGERATITLDAAGSALRVAVDTPSQTDIDQALAWKNTWLVFDRTPLSDAVEAFNRTGSHKIVLGDPALANRKLGGTFRADDVDAFVRLLHETLDIGSVRNPDGQIVLLPEH